MTVDVHDPRVFARGVPHDALAHLRDHDPVSWQAEPAIGPWPAGPGFWAVTRYDDVRTVLRDAAVFSSALGATQIRDPDPADLPVLRAMMLNTDPPDHLRLRRLVGGAFTRTRLARFAALARTRARASLTAARERGTFDLPPDVTDGYAVANLADFLGVPAADHHRLLEWTDRVIGYQDPEHGHVVLDERGRPVNPRSPDQLGDLFAYADHLVAAKRAEPGDDLVTALAHAVTPEGERLTADELRMFFFLLTIAGNDTVRSALPGAVLALLEHPDQHRLLAARPDLLPSAVEELLRWHPPVLTFRRTVARPARLGGRDLAVGDKVVVYHVSAHRDERRFPDPFRLDLRRDPNPHLAFGHGPHVCVGAAFARLQMTAFLAELLDLLPDVRAAGPAVRLTSNFINGLTHLPLTAA